MHTDEHVVEQVNRIIQTNIDRREGYEKAIDQVKDPSLRGIFEECCRQSNDNVNDLRHVVMQHGGKPADATSTSGDLYRIWMEIKEALSADNSKAVLQSCERGEDAALSTYKNVLEASEGAPVDAGLTDMLGRQKAGIRAMHDKVKALRDAQ